MERDLRGSWKLWTFTLLFIFSSSSVSSKAWAQAPEVLTLDDVVSMAVARSPEIMGAQEDILSAQADLDQARAGRWAQIDVLGVAGPSENAKNPSVEVSTKAVGNRFVGQIVNHDENSVGIFGRLDVTIAQPLFTFGKISHRQDAAAAGVEVQRAAKEKTTGEVIRNVKELYFAMIVANQGKSAANDTDSFISDARRRITAMIEHHSTNADQTDLYRLDAFAAQVKEFKAKADAGAVTAYQALKKTIDYPPNQEFQLDLKELPQDTRALGGEDEYVRKAMDQRPEFVEIKKGLEAKKSMVEAARADLYPSFFVTALGSFAGAPGREFFDNSYFPDEFNHVWGGAVLGAQWHFDFGIGRAKVRKAQAEYQRLLYTKDYADRNIPLQVIKYYQDAIEAKTSYEAAGKGAVSARKWIVTSFSNFDLGVGTAKDMFDAIDRYGKNQGDYLQALFNYNVALANLSYAIGEYDSQAKP